jgi:DNA-binding CsgD family transcriptional regulator
VSGNLCGRRGGYHRHITEDTPPCAPCREAERQAKERWRKRSYLNHGPLLVDATGTRRRIQALARVGWSAVEIARRMGVTHATVSYWAARKTVRVATAETVRRLYDELSMIPGPSVKSQQYARSKGWPPPLAWSDESIDDPAARPSGLRTDHEPRRINRDMEVEARVMELTRAGLSAAEIALRLRTNQRQVARVRARYRTEGAA